MYRDILVPTDGSETSVEAADHAANLASKYDARIHALYVVDGGSYATLEVGSEMVREALMTEGEEAVAAVADVAGEAGVDVETSVVEGNVHRELLDYVEERGVDLIVMGTHGRRGLDRYLLGSVTERIVRSSPVPVLTVRWASDEAASEANGAADEADGVADEADGAAGEADDAARETDDS